jgi:REP element-mobilizing transposase RayT
MSEYIHKDHNVTALLYHLVFLTKYRRVVFDEDVDTVVKDVCLGIEKRYEIKFVEIGTDKDHVHFFGAIGSWIKRYEAGDDDKKQNGTRGVQKKPASKKEAVGR